MNDIAWTFGIITVYEDNARLLEILSSIRQLNIPEYEILLVGGGDSSGVDGEDIVKIDFDELFKSYKKDIYAIHEVGDAKHEKFVRIFGFDYLKDFVGMDGKARQMFVRRT